MKLFKNLNDKLFDAVKGGDLAEINRLLQDSADVNAKDKKGYTPLQIAAATGNKDAAELLIGKGADVNGEGSGDVTALVVAAIFNRVDVAELLIAKGADVNGKGSLVSPLGSAVDAGQKDVGELLISNGANVDKALLQTVALCKKDMVEWLLSKGADVNAKNEDGRSVLRIAIWADNKDVVELLKKRGAVE